MHRALRFGAILVLALSSCAGPKPPPKVAAAPPPPVSVPLSKGPPPPQKPPPQQPVCGEGKKLRVHFYDVGQALAALVDLPDGRHLLVDTGDSRNPEGVQHLLASLRTDLGKDPIAVLWITHQHSDHIGGAAKVLAAFDVQHYVDNGTPGKTKKAEPILEVRNTRAVAQKRGVPIAVVDLAHTEVPLPKSSLYDVAAVLPTAWGAACNKNPNDCSIGLRIDFCASSVLFTGDAEAAEEKRLVADKPVTLVQIGHHGSDTSSSQPFLDRIKPKYAVISAGKPNVGTNTTYCHPSETTLTRLDALLGDVDDARPVDGFYGAACKPAYRTSWHHVPSSRRLWATERDGDVVLETSGDGSFVRIGPPTSQR